MKQDTLKNLLQRPAESVAGLFIAFDFGMKTIGVAVGQTTTASATPLKPLQARDGVPNWTEIQQLITHWQPIGFVVGIPLTLEGQVQPITHAAKRFAQKLSQRYHLPVYGIDEQLTSVAAYERMRHSKDKQYRKQSIDCVSAQIILEQWLHEMTHLKTE